MQKPGSQLKLYFKMAEKEGGGKLETESDEHIHTEPIHGQLSDVGQFSFGALCALSLRQLFEDEWHREFTKDTLRTIMNGLEQPKQVQESIQAIFDGQGQEDLYPFVDTIMGEEVLKGDTAPLLSELVGFAVAEGNYDARMRVLVKNVAWRLRVPADTVEQIECDLAESLNTDKYEMSEEEKKEQVRKAKRRKYKRFALIGLATVTGGTLIGLTGGLAAPLVAAGAGAIIGGAGAAALGSVAGVAIIGSLFGVAGAGLTGYKMKKRVGAIEEFEFEPLISAGPLQLQTVKRQLHITICVTGWINNSMPDFKQPWQNLAESQEQYSLRWESRYLRDMGQALDYIFNSAVSMATSEALKYTVLASIMAAIAWPSALLSASQVIDNPWSVALQRAVSTGRQLAEVLLTREQGKRPVTLIGYSLGGRVIYYCLEEMAKRKGCEGIIEDVIIMGAPVSGAEKGWSMFSRVVAGRIVNGYCKGDWLLKFLYRTSSAQLRIAGLGPVKWTNHHMHNIDLSDVVSGHLDYMAQLDTILRVIGIRVREGVKARPKLGLTPSTSTISGTASMGSSKAASLVSSKTSVSESLSPIASTSASSEDVQIGSEVAEEADEDLDSVMGGFREDYFSVSSENCEGKESGAGVTGEMDSGTPQNSNRNRSEGDANSARVDVNPLGHAATGTVNSTGGSMHKGVNGRSQADASAASKIKSVKTCSEKSKLDGSVADTTEGSILLEAENNNEKIKCTGDAGAVRKLSEVQSQSVPDKEKLQLKNVSGPGILKSTGGKIKGLFTKKSHAGENTGGHDGENKEGVSKTPEQSQKVENTGLDTWVEKDGDVSDDSYTSSDPGSPEPEGNQI